MTNTPFSTRSSEWIGDLTVYLRETGEDNSLQLERLRRNLRVARERELTPRQRMVVEMRYDQGLSGREIARRLKVDPSTVSRTLSRAKNRLRQYLRYTI